MKKYTFILFSVALLCIVLIERYLWVQQFFFLPTTDGYFYLQEFRAYLLQSASYYGTVSPFYPVIGFLGRVFQLTELQLYHGLVVASYIFLSSALILFLPKNLRWFSPALVTMIFLSDIIFMRHYAFLRQSFSWSLFLFAFAYHYTKSKDSSLIIRVCTKIVMFVAMSFHLFTATLGGLLLILSSKMNGAYKSVFAFIVIVISIGLAIFLDKSLFSFEDMTQLLAWIDVARTLEFATYEYFEFGLYTCLVVWLLFYSSVYLKKEGFSIFFFFLSLVLILPIWNKESGVDLRATLAFPWLLYPAAIISLRGTEERRGVLISVVFVYVALMVGFYTVSRTNYPLKSIQEKIVADYREPLSRWLDTNGFIQAPQGFNFAFTYYLGISSAKDWPRRSSFPSYYIFENRKDLPLGQDCMSIGPHQTDIPVEATCVLLSPQYHLRKIEKE